MLPNQIDIDKLLEHLVIVLNTKELTEKKDIIAKAFYDLYKEAYDSLSESNPDIPSHEVVISTDKNTNRYEIFKSFVMNSAIDCRMWELGSGKIRFTPYQRLWDYIYGDLKAVFVRSNIVKNYFEQELPEFFEKANRK